MSKKCATLDDAYQSHADWNNDYCQSFGYSAAQANDDAAEKANNNESLPERHRLLLDTITKMAQEDGFYDIPLPSSEDLWDMYDGADLERCEVALKNLATKDLKFDELNILAEFIEYLTTTYEGHYSQNNFQATEFIIDCGDGVGFSVGNVIKYAQRYGKKQGRNKADLMKIMHYALFAMRVHDLEVNDIEDEKNNGR